MKAIIGTIEVDGTPEEIAALIQAIGHRSAIAIPADPSADAEPISSRKFVSEEVAFRALKRRPLSREQGQVLKTLHNKYPGWTSASELCRAIKYSSSQFAGLLGAFGKRVTATEGYREGTSFFDQNWDYENSCNRYRLPESVRAAVVRAGI